jgi:hypothetical protein
LNNPNFNLPIFEGFKNESAKLHFRMSPQKWNNGTGAIMNDGIDFFTTFAPSKSNGFERI